jgi:nitroreductase
MKNIYAATLTSLLVANTVIAEELKAPATADCFTKLAFERHSGYAYDPSKQVSKQQLQTLVDIARLAPSSYNEQPWVFLICDKTTNPEAYQKAVDGLVEFNQKWAQRAPVLIIVAANTLSSKNNHFNNQAEYDTGAAAYGLTLGAASLGLMAHQMGGFDREKITRSFNIPKDFVPMAVIAIGYEAPDQSPKAKERKPLSDNVFYQSWGKTLN